MKGKGDFEEAGDTFTTAAQRCLLESRNNCLHIGESFLCSFSGIAIWWKDFLWHMHLIVWMAKKKMKLTQEFVSRVYVCVYTFQDVVMLSHNHSLATSLQSSNNQTVENKANTGYPEQPQECQTSITTKMRWAFLRYGSVALDLKLYTLESTWQGSQSAVLSKDMNVLFGGKPSICYFRKNGGIDRNEKTFICANKYPGWIAK